MITNEDDPMKPRDQMVVNQETPEGRVVNDLTIGEYDVVISTLPVTPSTRSSSPRR